MNIEHLGIAVKDIEKATEMYERLLGYKSYKQEEVDSEKVITRFFKAGETKIELLAATDSNSTISKFIEKRGEGIHHFALAVDDIIAEIDRLKTAGFEFVDDVPKKGADGKLVCFLIPKGTGGVLIELCQDIP